MRRYVYYHCTRQLDKNCRETFLREEALVAQLIQVVDKLNIDELGMTEIVKEEMEKLQRLLAVVSRLDSNQQNTFIMPKLDVMACARLILQDGSKEDKRKLLEQLKSRIVVKGGKLIIEKARKH